MADMDVDPPVQVKKEPKEGSEGKQRFEVKKVRWLVKGVIWKLACSRTQWNAVSLWAWGDLFVVK